MKYIWVKGVLAAASKGEEGKTKADRGFYKISLWLSIRAESLLIDPEGVTGIEL